MVVMAGRAATGGGALSTLADNVLVTEIGGFAEK
jgi:hypothetical protein